MAVTKLFLRKWVFPLFCTVIIVPLYVFAETTSLLQMETLGTNAAGGFPEYQQATAKYHYLIDEDMNETYQQLFGGIYSFGTWQIGGRGRERIGLRGECGLMMALGEPIVLDDTWTVNSSELQTLVAPVNAAILYRFSEGGERGFFAPYMGIGIGGFFGFERIAVDISRIPNGDYDWHDTRFRASFAGHALLGVNMGTGDGVRGILEVQWTQGGKGSLKYPSLTEEEIAEGWTEVIEDFQRPGFDFTGVSVSVGFQW